MKLSKQNVLYFSLGVIVIYWAYQLITAGSRATPPDSFYQFAGRIALIKLCHIATIFLLLRLEGASWSELGVKKEQWSKQLLMGLLFGFIMFLLFNVGLASVLGSMFPKPTGQPDIMQMYFNEPQNLYVWLVIGVLGGGVVEEFERIFVLTRFEKSFQKAGLYFALVVSSIVFGFGHLYQGTGLAIATGFSGLVLGLIYIRRRSALEVITAHAFSDVLAIIAAFKLVGH